MQKTCSKCKVEKPYEEFYKRKGGLAGLHASCKSCQNLSAKSKTPEQKARRKVTAKKRYLVVRDKRKEEAKAWKNKNPSYFRDYYHRKRKFVDQKKRLQKRGDSNNGTNDHSPKHDCSSEVTGLL